MLDNDIYAYTTDGKAISVNEYKENLDKIMIASDAGEKGYTTAQAKGKISRK